MSVTVGAFWACEPRVEELVIAVGEDESRERLGAGPGLSAVREWREWDEAGTPRLAEL